MLVHSQNTTGEWYGSFNQIRFHALEMTTSVRREIPKTKSLLPPGGCNLNSSLLGDLISNYPNK